MLLALSAALAAVVSSRSAPAFVGGALSRYLGRHVEIEAVEIRAGQALVVELVGVRVYEGARPLGSPVLQVPRAIATQSWPRLMVGQLLPGKWEVRGATLNLALPRPEGPALDLTLPDLPPLDLLLRDCTLILTRDKKPAVHVTVSSLVATRSRLRARVSGSADGRVAIGSAPLGRFEATLTGWGNDLELAARLQDLDLGVLPLPPLRRFSQPSGRARGDVRVRLAAGRIESSLDMRVDDFELVIDKFESPVAPKQMRVAAELAWDGQSLRIRPNPLRLDDLSVTGEVVIGTGAEARVSGHLDAADFEPGVPSLARIHPLSLMGLRFATFAQLDQRIEAARVESLNADFDLPLRDLGASISFKRKLDPEELSVMAQVRDGVYRTSPSSPPLEGVSGRFELSGNRIRAFEVRMSQGGRELPRLDITIDGMHRLVRLPPEERQVPTGPGVGIPGLPPAARALRSEQQPGRAPPVVAFDDLQIGYRPFLLPIRDARGTLRFPDGTLVVEDADAVVGGVPARVSATFDPDANTVVATVLYGDGEAGPRRDPGEYWLSSRFAIDPLHLGDWRLDQVEGDVRVREADVEFPEIHARFSSGPARGSGQLSLADPGGADYEFLMSVSDADAQGLCEPLGRPPGSIQGTLALDGYVRGRLEPGSLFLDHAELGLAGRIQDGTFGSLPALVVLARLPSLSGVRGLFGADLPFDVVSADIEIKGGVVRSQNFALQGSELRAHARGSVDLVAEDLPSDFTLAFLFLQTVDRVIGTVPIIGKLVLGKDRSLLTLYLQVDGPWEDPRVRPLPPGAVRGPANWAVKVVASGASQLLRIFGGGRQEEGAEDGSGAGQAP